MIALICDVLWDSWFIYVILLKNSNDSSNFIENSDVDVWVALIYHILAFKKAIQPHEILFETLF